MAKKAKKKTRVTLRSLKRELKAERDASAALSERLRGANKERVELFHKVGQLEALASVTRDHSIRIVDVMKTVLGRQDQPAPPMANMMMVSRK